MGILGTSICSDEINTVNGTMVDLMKQYWGTNFPLGGIGGAPYVGKTGFFAFSHHVPDNGNVLVVYGPHVGITASGEVGKCLRVGQSKESTACGACVAAYQQSLAGVAFVSLEAVTQTVTAIANTKFGPGHLALVGGIQLNMPKGYPDYFLPCSFTIQKGDEVPEDLLGVLTRCDAKLGA